jgi:hypothetical protein
MAASLTMKPSAGSDEPEQTLARIARETIGFADSALAHTSSRAGGEEPPQDAIERWGRRIGRLLGALFFVILILNLFTHWFF